MATTTVRHETIAEFLAWERQQEWRHEYVHGIVRERVSSTYTHSVIAAMITGELMQQLSDSGGEVLGSRMGLLAGQNYVYSDLLILCDEPDLYDHHEDALLNPHVTVEIVCRRNRRI